MSPLPQIEGEGIAYKPDNIPPTPKEHIESMKKNLLPLAALLPLCAAAQQRYNIVYIMTDDHTAQMLFCV